VGDAIKAAVGAHAAATTGPSTPWPMEWSVASTPGSACRADAALLPDHCAFPRVAFSHVSWFLSLRWAASKGSKDRRVVPMGREVSKRSQLAIFFAGALLVMQGSGTRSVIAQEGKGDALLITAHPNEGGGVYSQIICVKADRFGRHVLTPEKEFAADPALSPDGKRIAFVAGPGGPLAHPQGG